MKAQQWQSKAKQSKAKQSKAKILVLWLAVKKIITANDRHPRLARGSKDTNSDCAFIPRSSVKHGMTTSRKAAFTLIELSVVLVIIGLIVGGVLAGQDLIKAAQLRAVLSDIEHYNTAVHTFQLKYNALPGDMPNATDFWGANGNDTATPENDNGMCGYYQGGLNPPTTATSTCNGDGDGLIYGGISAYTMNEPIYFWRHLQDSGLVNCNCSGKSYNGYGMVYPSFNAPLSPLGNGSGYGVISNALLAEWANGGTAYYASYTGHYFTIGTSHGTYDSGSSSLFPALTATEAYNLDSKIDDGIPSTGTVISQNTKGGNYPSYTPLCATNLDPSLAKYNIATSGIICSLIFKASF